ncbi:MAG: DUF4974 domain-containing protein [Muribaculaceae bacterium]|nr:DUF4974 domain-containing protein [Muribaculaceae bacterium]
MKDKNIDFVLRHFRFDAFNPEENWRNFIALAGLRRRRVGVAAVVASIIVLSTSAAIFTYTYRSTPSAGSESAKEVTVNEICSVSEPELMIFESTRLSEVVETVEIKYGVRINNVPSNANEYVLTLRFEGTPEELIDAINEILGTRLTVEKI